jgi:hypothetical protein
VFSVKRIRCRPHPSRPLSLSKIETRMLRVPKSIPATILVLAAAE